MTTNHSKQPICRHCLEPIHVVIINDTHYTKNADGSNHKCLQTPQNAPESTNDSQDVEPLGQE